MQDEDEDEVGVIEIRGLDGTSTVVRISPDRTVGDLKILLLESFPPAKKSPDFRLFYKGAQLGVRSRIGSHRIERGEFLVVVPFAKRTRGHDAPPERECSGSTAPSKRYNHGEASTHAESAWLDIMQDLRSLSENTEGASPLGNSVAPLIHACPRKQDVPMSRNTDKTYLESRNNTRESVSRFLQDLLDKSSGVSSFQSTCPNPSQIQGLVTCLSDPYTGNCLFLEESRSNSGEEGQCACPLWLKRLVKCFSFLNTAHGFLLMHHSCIKWGSLKEAVDQARGPKIEDFSILDLEHLLVLCPKVVMLGTQEMVMAMGGDALVILDSSVESEDQSLKTINSRIHVSRTSTIRAIEKRENAFKTDLCRMVRFAIGKALSRNIKPFILSLEDLISWKNVIAFSEGCEAKLGKTGKTRSLDTDTYSRCLCHVGKMSLAIS